MLLNQSNIFATISTSIAMSSNLTSNDVQEENIENDNEFATEEIEDDCDNQVAEADLVPAEPKKGMIFAL
ncbi:hypothetical protein PVAP13_5NG405840 [Panicum virgatum]|uniref:Uncharacterized protein n=1 Tax=Panicum virgatum TaxID=38727 RepID=A0A8T0S103_PANVG|nr:hypothetical protein PVAP13_5NG405840 [Panicum virgatum]